MSGSETDELLYRSMKVAADGQPELGASATQLGTRSARLIGPGVDIAVDERGQVWPLRGGMSVAPDDPWNLPPFRRPPDFGGTARTVTVWSIGVSELPPE